MAYTLNGFATADESVRAYNSGKCEVFTSDVSQLYSERLQLDNPDDHFILPEVIWKEPLGATVPQGDDQWLNVIKWTHFAMINAEELGVSSIALGEALNRKSRMSNVWWAPKGTWASKSV
jgi:general L-amino acid transport system substrate-binding protein